MQKSMSKSGMLTRSGFRKRSNSSLFAIGSMSVMRVAVRDQRAGARTAARTDGDAVVLGVADEVPDDQEVAREVHLLDDAQLQRQPRGVGVAVDLLAAAVRLLDALLQAVLGDRLQVRLGGHPVRHLELRQERFAQLELDVAQLAQLGGVLQRLRDVLEVRLHLRRRLHEEGVVAVVHPLLVVDRLLLLHAHQDLVRARVVLIQVVAVVGRHHADAGLLRHLDQVAVDLLLLLETVRLQLEEEVPLAEDVLELLGGRPPPPPARAAGSSARSRRPGRRTVRPGLRRARAAAACRCAGCNRSLPGTPSSSGTRGSSSPTSFFASRMRWFERRSVLSSRSGAT